MEKGKVIWISGLAGAGKTTISKALYDKIKKKYQHTVLLDGDIIRDILKEYGYSKEERLLSAKKISALCSFLANNGIIVICATISLFEEVYVLNRKNIKNYFEVFVECSMEELIRRDQKNLYTDALSGKINNVVGVDIDYIRPQPHYVLDNNSRDNLEKKIEQLYEEIELFFDKLR
ncbi:adenylyl-sulfate kinase [Campylobacter insulaenigrae]|uniref:adenylyl-sulfate kinase n=1 Tax=Campylobacter insulaenigrae TaxID=260714 RepID=UPI0021527A3B|nr:adenylyl-sulfate kinase [Campylobacter insulaenigrae]MCR6594026.1 adenylyl-sulfate kinase [Campylobacter insulaenigrae]